MKLVEKSIELNANTMNVTGQTNNSSISSLCGAGNGAEVISNFESIVDTGDINSIKCTSNVFSITGKNQFANYTAKIDCSTGTTNACKITELKKGSADLPNQ